MRKVSISRENWNLEREASKHPFGENASGFRCGAVQLRAEGLQVFHDDLARIHFKKTFGLQTHEIARNQFAHRAQPMGQLLMRGGKLKLEAACGLRAGSLRQLDQRGDEPLTNGGEGKLFNEAHQAPQARAYDGKNLERDFGVFHAVSMKVAARDEDNFRFFDSRGRGGIRPAIEDRQLSDSFSGAVYGKHLLATVDGRLEDAHLAARDNVQTIAGLAFRKQQLARGEPFAHGTAGKSLELRLRKALEQLCMFENDGEIDARRGHQCILPAGQLNDARGGTLRELDPTVERWLHAGMCDLARAGNQVKIDVVGEMRLPMVGDTGEENHRNE